MPEPTYVPCPHCGHPYPMTALQKELYRGRTLSCNNCAKTFSADELTPVVMETVKPWSPAAPLVCPSTSHTSASGQSPQAVATDLGRGGHLSYVYIGDTYSTGSGANP